MYTDLAIYYDQLVAAHSAVEWSLGIMRLLSLNGLLSGSVIDLGCGTGIGGEKLQESGNYQITGLDQSAKMIEIAKRKRPHHYCRFVQSNMMETRLDVGQHDIACMGFDTINHFGKSTRNQLFSNIGSMLNPDGYFAFDFFEIEDVAT